MILQRGDKKFTVVKVFITFMLNILVKMNY